MTNLSKNAKVVLAFTDIERMNNYTKDDLTNDFLEIQKEEEEKQEESDRRYQTEQEAESLIVKKSAEAVVKLLDKDKPPSALDNIKGACAIYNLLRRIFNS